MLTRPLGRILAILAAPAAPRRRTPPGARRRAPRALACGLVAFVAFTLAVAVAAYGQLLRGDTNMGRFTFADARSLAEQGAGRNWWRQEFVELTRLAERQRFAGGDK